MFVYYLFDNGDLLDEYNSTPPPNHDAADADQKNRFQGRPEILMNYSARPGTNRGDIEIALRRGRSLIEGGFAPASHAETLHPLAQALRMDDLRTTLGYIDFDRRQASIPQGRDFIKIDGRKSRRPTARRIPPQMPRPR